MRHPLSNRHNTQKGFRRATAAVLTTVTAAALVATITALPAGAVGADSFAGTLLGGGAFGAAANVKIGLTQTAFGLQPVARQTLNPSAEKPHGEDHVGSASFAPGTPPMSVLGLGAVVDEGKGTRGSHSSSIEESSTIASADLLGGLVQATDIQARAHGQVDNTGFNWFSTADDHPAAPDGSTGVTFASLSIGGTPVPLDQLTPPANTVIAIPGVGHLVLNEQLAQGIPVALPGLAPQRPGLEVVALHLYVSAATLIKGNVAVADARGSFTVNQSLVAADAYTVSVAVGKVLRLAPVGLVRTHQDEGRKTATVAHEGQAGLLDVTAGHNVVNSTTHQGIRASADAATSAVNLLDGLITASAADSTVSTHRSQGTIVTTTSVQILDLMIGGQPVSFDPTQVTKIDLPGLGYILIGDRECNSDGSDPTSCTAAHIGGGLVRALDVVVNVPDNPLGLDLGTEIVVAQAHTSLVN